MVLTPTLPTVTPSASWSIQDPSISTPFLPSGLKELSLAAKSSSQRKTILDPLRTALWAVISRDIMETLWSQNPFETLHLLAQWNFWKGMQPTCIFRLAKIASNPSLATSQLSFLFQKPISSSTWTISLHTNTPSLTLLIRAFRKTSSLPRNWITTSSISRPAHIKNMSSISVTLL